MSYRELGLEQGSGALAPEYERAGAAAYAAHVVALGLHDEPPFDALVWAQRYAWCEAARAARAVQ